MGKRRKTRTHVKTEDNVGNVPRSFVVKHGQVGNSLTQLVRDMRKVLEPNTAAKLKVRISELKDLPGADSLCRKGREIR
jgi:ribosome biogenesis protein SSF1/2